MPSQERFRVLFEEAPSGMAILSLDGRWLHVNRALGDLLGYTVAELAGDSADTFVHPADLTGGDQRRRLLAAEVRSVRLEQRFIRRDGAVVWVRVSTSLVRDEHDQPEHFVAQYEDITEAKTIEQALARERRWLQESQEAGRIGSWEIDLESGVMRWSDEQFHLYGVDSGGEAPQLETLLKLIHPEDRHGMLTSLRSNMASGEDFVDEWRIVHPARGVRTLLVRGRYLPRNAELARPARMAGTTQDVTAEHAAEAERLRAQERLLNNERQMDDAQALAHVGSWEWELARDRPTWSTELARIYGFDPAYSPRADDLIMRVHPDDRAGVQKMIARARHGISTEGEYRIMRPDGELRHVHGRHHTRIGSRGEVTHVYGAVQDVTERKHYEAELQRLATHDPLTGLPNRRTFDERLAQELARSRRDGSPLSLALLDIDNFKRINDTLGHPVGDGVLTRAGEVLHRQVRSHELIARVGGEEFAWILPSADAHGASLAVERMRAALAVTHFGEAGHVTLSAGVCTLADEDDASSLYRCADMALLAAKKGGRNRVVGSIGGNGAGAVSAA